MIDQRVYWIWLQQALGAGSSKIKKILAEFPSIQDFYEARQEKWISLHIFTQKELTSFSSYSLEKALKLFWYCDKQNQEVYSFDSPEYPKSLKYIHSPPCVLYSKGASLPDLENNLAISIVGTREATSAGKKIAFSLASDLAKTGTIIISGSAKGIDMSAHNGVLSANGQSICVLGASLDYFSLEDLEPYKTLIASKQVHFISEFPPKTSPSKFTYPIRNRIISALSKGTLVVEAGEKSGALITANFALEQNKDVFATPCGLDNPVSKGVNTLIQNGAKLVMTAKDIIEEYSSFSFHELKIKVAPKEKDNFNKKDLNLNLSKDANLVFQNLSPSPQHLLEIQENIDIPIAQILAALTELELLGHIKSYAGRKYALIETTK